MFASDMTARILQQLQLVKQVLIWEIMNSLFSHQIPDEGFKQEKESSPPTGPQLASILIFFPCQ